MRASTWRLREWTPTSGAAETATCPPTRLRPRYGPLNGWSLTFDTSGCPDADYQPGEWHHLAMTYDGSELRFTVNGLPQNGGLGVAGTPNYQGPVTLDLARCYEGRDPALYWQGTIDEVRVYDRALSDTELGVIGRLPLYTIHSLAGPGLIMPGMPVPLTASVHDPLDQIQSVAFYCDANVSFRQACMNRFRACGIVGRQHRTFWRTADGYQGERRASCEVGGGSAAV
jgi:hypothetical protein